MRCLEHMKVIEILRLKESNIKQILTNEKYIGDAQLVTGDGLVKESGLCYDRSIHAKRSSVLSYNIENRKELWAKSCEYCGL